MAAVWPIETTTPWATARRMNCGACGYAGCRAFAEAAVGGEVAPAQCTQLGKAQISEALARYDDLDAVHFVSHGSAGAVNCFIDSALKYRRSATAHSSLPQRSFSTSPWVVSGA